MFGIFENLDMSKTINIKKMFDYSKYAFKETDNIKELR
jgi:hypothetical protein